MSYEIWLSERIVRDDKGFMRICRKISSDRIFKRKIEVSEQTLEFLEKIREKQPSEHEIIKTLVENL